MEWETTPGRSYGDVARALGVAVPTVFHRARREGWTKLLPEAPVDELAQVRADAKQHIVDQASELVEVEMQEVLDFSVAIRVKAINRWRADWKQHRELFPQEVCAQDPAAARRGKTTAEMLTMRQRGEALAFGLIEYTGRSTDAPLTEPVEEVDKPKPRWERLLEAFATGAPITEFMTPAGAGVPRLEQDPNSDD